MAVVTPAIVDGLRAADLCAHANEVPATCPCAPRCYCKTATCANRPPRGLGANFTIPGVVRVKKNSLRRIKRGDRVLTVSSAAHATWEAGAALFLRSQSRRTANPSGWGALNLQALIYLDREPGRTNLDNLIASVMDALEKAGVVPDDCVIRGLDGSRIRLDRKNPRVEIRLTPLEEP